MKQSKVKIVIRGLDLLTESDANDFFGNLQVLIINAGLIYEVVE